ncbi:MAG TPA: hypothetical protein VGB66_13230 [Longimicrobium sp.]|jgi:hypothetical protein
MRVRTYAFATLALGILVGAGGCTSGESPTSPLAPGGPSAVRGGNPNAGAPTDTTSASVTGGLIGAGSRKDGGTVTAAGGLIGAGS